MGQHDAVVAERVREAREGRVEIGNEERKLTYSLKHLRIVSR